MSVSQILISCGYLMCWQGYKLLRKLSGLGHVSLILSLAATLANAAVARLNDAHALPIALSPQYVVLTQQLLVLVSVAGLYVFRLAVEKCTNPQPPSVVDPGRRGGNGGNVLRHRHLLRPA
jgi:hypothetical protein